MRGALSKPDVARTFREKTIWRGARFVARYRATQNSSPRVGFAFSRTTGTAVLRNLFKRRWRAVTRETLSGVGVDVLFLVKGKLADIKAEQWCAEREAFVRFFHGKLESLQKKSQSELDQQANRAVDRRV